MPPPIAVIEPSYIWHRRAMYFSLVLLLVVLVGGYFVPYILLLAPVVAYRAIHSQRFLQPGRVGIEMFEDRLVCKSAFGKRREIRRDEVVRFLSVYRGTTEVVVARTQEVDIRGTQDRLLIHTSDIQMPMGLMRNPGLVRRLEVWRMGDFSTESLIPPRSEE